MVRRSTHTEAVAQIESTYAKTPTPIYFHTRDEVAAFFSGLDVVSPGVVTVDAWQPDPSHPGPAAPLWLYGAVGRKG